MIKQKEIHLFVEGVLVRKLLILSFVTISMTTLIGCAPSIHREGYALNENVNAITDCKIIVTSNQNYKGKIIGKIKIGDSGLSTKCSESDALNIIKNEGCQIGADVAILSDIKQPDLMSSCYRVTGEFIKLDSSKIEAKENQEYSQKSVAVRENKSNELQILGYILGFAVGFSITFFLFSHH